MEELDEVVNEFYKGLDLTKTIDKTRLKYNQLQQENTQLKQQLKDIEEYLESIKDMPDADMYIELGEYKEFKHILDLIHKGKEID